MKIKHYLLIALMLGAAVAVPAQQQKVTIRVCTYNLLNFGQPTAARSSALGFILQRLDADILVFHQIEGVNGFTEVKNVLPTLQHFQAAEFFDGENSDNAMFYDSSKVSVIAHTTIPTDLRTIDQWTAVVRLTGDTIEVYGCHLKNGETTADQNQREQEVIAYREAAGFAPPTRHRIMAGDLNVYSDSEPAYNLLAGITDTPIHFGDPINREGSWHSNLKFADIHTQSTRIDQFDGGTGGGLNDRFDFVLISPSLSTHLVPGSYTTFGNDGQHFNDSINHMPNTAVDPQTAESLYVTSDHLPVYLDLVFNKNTAAVEERKLGPGEMDLSSWER